MFVVRKGNKKQAAKTYEQLLNSAATNLQIAFYRKVFTMLLV